MPRTKKPIKGSNSRKINNIENDKEGELLQGLIIQEGN